MSKQSVEPNDTALIQERLSNIRAAAQCTDSPDSAGDRLTPGSANEGPVPEVTFPTSTHDHGGESSFSRHWGDNNINLTGTETNPEIDMEQVARWLGYPPGQIPGDTTATRSPPIGDSILPSTQIDPSGIYIDEPSWAQQGHPEPLEVSTPSLSNSHNRLDMLYQ